MLLNDLNKKKDKQILKKYKLDKKYKMNKISLNNMIFIFEHIKKNQRIKNLMLLLLKWKQLVQIQKKLLNNSVKKLV